MRVLVGVGAWLIGVGAATGGSLLAVSLLGQGIAASTTQQLTATAVTRALASEASEASEAAQPGQLGTSRPAAASSATRSPRTRRPTIPPSQAEASPSDSSSSARPSPTYHPHATASTTPTPTPTPTPSRTSTVLTSQGGTVVAECVPGGAYLLSWSPTQGYEVGPVLRGPAPNARVAFNSIANTVTMVVSCTTAGVPTATTTVTTGTSGGGGHDE